MGCEPRVEALIANRSGHDIIIYMDGKDDSFLLDGYDKLYIPLRSDYFKENDNIYIAICPREDFFNGKCNNVEKINFGNVKSMVVNLEKFKEKNKTYATYILDDNFKLNLSKYNDIKHMRYRTDKNGNEFLIPEEGKPLLIKK